MYSTISVLKAFVHLFYSLFFSQILICYLANYYTEIIYVNRVKQILRNKRNLTMNAHRVLHGWDMQFQKDTGSKSKETVQKKWVFQ